ncbi:hypothetical protein [Desulfoferrobacter suflitae]|uniref:hypothetical protein n=1 Tax=Desulfoferrobacter suflitae TaxID=2865782 RepID=UPI0021647BAB|nr:hypothetical protein [Desulfoferrobacter suflitae]MCK8601460.1 hypothetical protein [Desulfoferrobacter suflitae]
MEAKKGKSTATKTAASPMEGTNEMGYWEFKKGVADSAGWQLQRTEPQTYLVLNSSRQKIGIFKSGKGYFPNLADAASGSKTQPE